MGVKETLDRIGWYRVTWTDADCHEVLSLCCHSSELADVLNWWTEERWAEMVCREPVESISEERLRAGGLKFWHKNPVKVGDEFEVQVNQGLRPCLVVAKDEETEVFLYNYEMPNGRLYYREAFWDAGQLREKVMSLNQLKASQWATVLPANPKEASKYSHEKSTPGSRPIGKRSQIKKVLSTEFCTLCKAYFRPINDVPGYEKSPDPKLCMICYKKTPRCGECEMELERYEEAADTGKGGWRCPGCGWSWDDE